MPSPGDRPRTGMNPYLLPWHADSLPLNHQGGLISFLIFMHMCNSQGFPGGAVVREKNNNKENPPANAGHANPIPGSGRSPGEGNGKPLWHSCMGNSMDQRSLAGYSHGVTRSGIQLSTQAHAVAKETVMCFFTSSKL